MSVSEEFAKKMKEVRGRNGLKQKDLAAKIGATPQTISAYEKKGKTPTLENVASIAKALGVSLDWLCGIDTITFEDEDQPLSYGSIARSLTAMLRMGFAEFTQVMVKNGDILTSHDFQRDPELARYEEDFERIPHLEIVEETLANFLNSWKTMAELLESGQVNDDIFYEWEGGRLSALDGLELADN